jgi:hypothetical protein
MISHLEELRRILTPNAPAVTLRSHTFEFVNAYTNAQFYYSKSFPKLFPFGRGCPTDPLTLTNDIKAHSQKLLKRGGGPYGRRFQQTPSYYFTVYSYLMKQKIGGIATLAQKVSLDGTAQPETIPTIGEVDQLLQYLGSNKIPHCPHVGPSSNPQPHDIVNIKKLIARLVPYSKPLHGTEMGIRYEKKNLMALIPSPVINSVGYWRWFITFAPADLYDHRLYEILCKTDTEDTWAERQIKVNVYKQSSSSSHFQHLKIIKYIVGDVIRQRCSM